MSERPNRLLLSLGGGGPVDWTGVALALAIGGAGAVVFLWLTMPLPWMIGAAVFVSVAALAGVPVAPRVPGRSVMFAVLGVLMGSAFQPEVLAAAGRWAYSMGAMLGYVAVGTAMIAVALRRAGFDRVTSFFSASPGGLSVMILMGGQMGGDDRAIALMHSIRITLTVLLVGTWYRVVHGYVPSGNAVLGGVSALGGGDALALVAMGAIGWWLGVRLRVPGGAFLGPVAASGLAHAMSWTAAVPPGEAVSFAQLVVGTAIGCRFAGTRVGRYKRALAMGVVSTAFLIGLAALFAWPLAAVVGLPFQSLFLAFAPGGLTEMSLIAVTLGVDPAFVTTHHVFRLLVILTVVPVLFRRIAAPAEDPGG